MPDALERQLRDLAAEAAWPPTPDVAGAVAARLAAAPAHRRGSRRARLPRRRLVLALAAALLLAPAAALALPGPRHAILDALGLRHVRVERRATPPAAVRDPRLGLRATPAAASRRAGFTATWPAALGRPGRAYVLGGIVTYIYERPRVLLAQARGALEHDVVLRKFVSVDGAARLVRVRGRRGVWLSRPHAYAWSDATGPPVRSGPALVWERGDRVLRLEGARSLRHALRIAESVR